MHFISKPMTFAKLFILLTFSGFIVYIMLALYTFHAAYFTITELQRVENDLKMIQDTDYQERVRFQKDLKYILLWTSRNSYPFDQLSEGQATFIEQKCPSINCFITGNRSLLNEDYTNFDAVLFNGMDLQSWKPRMFPKHRAAMQKYVFVSKQSAEEYPICNIKADNFFNLTWTYRLDSDISSPFIEIRDKGGRVVGPKLNMSWISDKEGLSTDTKHKFRSKYKAVVWLSSKCVTRNNRMHYVKALKARLREYKLTLDIYGPCGSMSCSNNSSADCYKMVENDYYFYIAFEKSFSQDYVTQEVLGALNNYAVPIVFGTNDYSNFLPPGSYLQVHKKTPENIATNIDYAIRNPNVYHRYHEWRNHYTFHEVLDFGKICHLCDILNDEELHQSKTYHDFRQWWFRRPLRERCFPLGKNKRSVNRICGLCDSLNDEENFGITSSYDNFRAWWSSRPLEGICSSTNKYNYSRLESDMRV